MQRLELTGDIMINVPPALPNRFIDEIKIETEARPNAHLVGRSDRNPQEPFELGFRIALLAKTFRNIRANRFRGPANFDRQAHAARFEESSSLPDEPQEPSDMPSERPQGLRRIEPDRSSRSSDPWSLYSEF